MSSLKPGAFILMADRGHADGAIYSQRIWLPIQFGQIGSLSHRRPLPGLSDEKTGTKRLWRQVSVFERSPHDMTGARVTSNSNRASKVHSLAQK